MGKFVEEFWMLLAGALAVVLPPAAMWLRAWFRSKTRALENAAEIAAVAAELESKKLPLHGPAKMEVAMSHVEEPLRSRSTEEQRAMIERVLPRVRSKFGRK